MPKGKYREPELNLNTKRDIARHISSINLPEKKALELINNVLRNFDSYWYDSPKSEKDKGKYVRSASKSQSLKTILKLINKNILCPQDKHLPLMVYGGVSSKDNIKAAKYLKGKRGNRILLKLDIRSFYEQVSRERVFYFFHKICGCGPEASNILSDVCCVPEGEKNSGSMKRILARGFSPSSRLAAWTSVNLFQRLEWEAKKILKGKDLRIAIYVDDIGITASGTSVKEMEKVKEAAINVLENYDVNHTLPVHRREDKTLIEPFEGKPEYLGILFDGNTTRIGEKTSANLANLKEARSEAFSGTEKEILDEKISSVERYKKRVER